MSARALDRDLGLFRVYRLLSTSYLFAPVIVLFFASRGLSMTEVTLLNSVYCVTAMLFEVPTGLLADRWGRKRAMVLGSLMMAAGCLLDWLGHSFALFAVSEGLLALGLTLSSGSDSAWLFDRLREAGREHDYRREEGSATAAKLAGGAAALVIGGFIARSDVAATYLLSVVVCLGAAGVAALLGEATYERPPSRGWMAQTVASARLVGSHAPLRFAVGFSMLVFTLVRMAIYLHQPYLSAAGLGIGGVGLVLGGLSLISAFAAHRIDRLRRAVGERTLVWGLPAVLAVSYLLLGEWFATWGIALLAVQVAASGVYSPLSKDLLNREIADSSHRATLLSVESMARRLAFGLFAPLCGLLIDGQGLAGGLRACGALAAVGAAVLGARMIRRRRVFSPAFEGERTPTPVPAVAAAEAAAAPAIGGE